MTTCMDIPPVEVKPVQTKSKTEEKVECAVCSDKSTGKHYGVSTCEGCKSFFKRTVRNSTSYTCRGQNNCHIDRHSRSRCPACRFQKCLDTGMKKEGNTLRCFENNRICFVNFCVNFCSLLSLTIETVRIVTFIQVK